MLKTFLIVLCVFLLFQVGCVPEGEAGTGNAVELDPLIIPDDFVACLINVSQIRYVPDPPGTDYWQSPAETVAKGQGDCEDICIYLQHRLKRKGIHVEVVFGLKTTTTGHGHCWCEYEQDGELYIVEPSAGTFLKRKALPAFLYVRADDIDVVKDKVKAYHQRTGVHVNSAYRGIIESEKE